jgi:hypothetical protein
MTKVFIISILGLVFLTGCASITQSENKAHVFEKFDTRFPKEKNLHDRDTMGNRL